MKLANILKAYRKAEGLSMRGTAKIVGIDYTALHRFESGRPVSNRNLVKIILWMFEV